MGLTMPDAITIFGGCLVVIAAIIKFIPNNMSKKNNGKYLRMDVFDEFKSGIKEDINRIDNNIERIFHILDDKK